MKKVVALLALSLNACATQPQSLVVSDYGYYLNGTKADEMAAFGGTLSPDRPVDLQACLCAKTARIVAATEWLRAQGVKDISIEAVRHEDVEVCGPCK